MKKRAYLPSLNRHFEAIDHLISKPLTTSFRNYKQAFQEHFDHRSFLSVNCDFSLSTQLCALRRTE